MRIGIACPYSWDVPGGVQFHIRDLAEELIRRGHDVRVITPAEDTTDLPDYFTSTGAAIPIRYNGSVARLSFGPRVNACVRKWIREGNFDVIHVHEPFIPSVSMLALMSAECPVVSTFHTAMDRSLALEIAAPALRPVLDKIQSRIAVSQEARRTAVQYLGGDAYIIPNGVYTRTFEKAPQDNRFTGTAEHPTIGFLGRIDEPRKGLPVVAAAFTQILEAHPGVRLFVAGRGDEAQAREMFGESAGSVEFLGGVSEEDKEALLSSVDIYLAPNTGGESFGIILVEAMSAGSFVISSDIPAFRAVLGNGEFGSHFSNDDAESLAQAVISALAEPEHRADVVAKAHEEAHRYDWDTVASQVFAVYETAYRTAHMEVPE
ncbi:glycosyltransferase family 4 protein [Ancrocorticia populi]|uniref:Alpha-(1-2)-phosphatidylinositol mannosyltransferase n=2 Tax=Ancrocorticia populi TaxID=2175228 RepID=A0A2V1K2Y6_9ACTO|nr:glycosyltransferase family 4 protein [Ancrocorticia populi]PWF24583.1 alpha-(1-2)-phosphatidylinositol mannosyltransferase [Ancrocorticia populi]